MENKSLLIIVINYCRYEDTIRCLESLSRVKYKNFTVFVIDNASKNNSIEKLSSWIINNNEKGMEAGEIFNKSSKIKKFIFMEHKYKLIETTENFGFGGGVNIGIDYAICNNYDYILLLNNDTFVEENFLDPLIELAESSNDIGIVGGKAICVNNNNIINTGGKINWIRGYGNKLLAKNKLNVRCEVDFVSGCHMLIKKVVLKTIGNFSEHYFLYYEDVDYCLRARGAGWKVFYQPDSVIWHSESISIGKDSALRYFYLTRSRIIFNKAHNKLFPIFFIYLSALHVFKIIIWILSGKVNHVKAAILAELNFFKDVDKF